MTETLTIEQLRFWLNQANAMLANHSPSSVGWNLAKYEIKNFTERIAALEEDTAFRSAGELIKHHDQVRDQMGL